MTRSSKRLWAFAAASAAVTPSSTRASSLLTAGFATEPRRSTRVNKSKGASAAAAASPVVASNTATSASTTTPSSKKRKPAPAARVSPAPVSLPKSSTKKSKKHQPSATTSKKKSAPRTQSFGAQVDPNVEPHTLILGTHPSIQSLDRQQYYGHTMNAFWWIAGDCLGFRRGTAVSPATDKPYKFAADLRHGNDSILSYPEQVNKLLESGFCLWDVVATCERPGSLDQDICNAVPNDIYAFCQAYPSIRRIVLANGGSSSKEFIRHFADWLASGQLVVSDQADDGEEGNNGDFYSAKAFGTVLKRLSNKKKKNSSETELQWTSPHTISLVSAISVSPAAAKFSYIEKREFWERYVYQPGLEVLRQQQ